MGNRRGLFLDQSDDSRLIGNVIENNADFGLINDPFGGLAPAPSGATGNLVVRNALRGNGINADDSSDRVPSAAEVQARLAAAPVPPEVLGMIRANPAFCRQIVEAQRAAHVPGLNRRDDGAPGNHHDDCDDPAEGFVDRDGDGIGEAGRPIPGGGAADRFPLAAPR